MNAKALITFKRNFLIHSRSRANSMNSTWSDDGSEKSDEETDHTNNQVAFNSVRSK